MTPYPVTLWGYQTSQWCFPALTPQCWDTPGSKAVIKQGWKCLKFSPVSLWQVVFSLPVPAMVYLNTHQLCKLHLSQVTVWYFFKDHLRKLTVDRQTFGPLVKQSAVYLCTQCLFMCTYFGSRVCRKRSWMRSLSWASGGVLSNDCVDWSWRFFFLSENKIKH